MWNSFDITGHLCPYIPIDFPELCRNVLETLAMKGHFVTGAEKLMASPTSEILALYIVRRENPGANNYLRYRPHSILGLLFL